MGVKRNTITFNGRIYDATTGQVVGHTAEPAKQALRAKPAKPARASKTISVTVKDTAEPTVISPSKPLAETRVKKATHTRPSAQRAHSIHVKTERSKTLRRSGLAKPTVSKPIRSKAGLATQPNTIHITNNSATRTERAQHIIRSNKVSKFASAAPVHHKTAHIPVKVAPEHKASHSYNIEDTPPTLAIAAETVRETITKSADIFENALQSATSHHVTTSSRKKRKGLRAAATVSAAVLLLVVFFAQQNTPRMALRAARSEIGFAASLPSYQPSGFGLKGKVQYQKGLVLANYQSNSDDRGYTITQTTANFDNYGLASNLAAQGKDFEVNTVDGQRIYVSRSGATWVKHGVWYTIDGNAGLNTEQLSRIATSL
ncbi:hypothetical protein EKI60_02175 [Candidatus Saccharibacteria bacterium]|nr:MAG: hypothetical protein EKI60_02175 [Candidatus Saccharibacteria bacterium]